MHPGNRELLEACVENELYCYSYGCETDDVNVGGVRTSHRQHTMAKSQQWLNAGEYKSSVDAHHQ